MGFFMTRICIVHSQKLMIHTALHKTDKKCIVIPCHYKAMTRWRPLSSTADLCLLANGSLPHCIDVTWSADIMFMGHHMVYAKGSATCPCHLMNPLNEIRLKKNSLKAQCIKQIIKLYLATANNNFKWVTIIHI